MNYNERKAKASMFLDTMIKNTQEKTNIATYILEVELKFGFGKKFVVERINNLKATGKVLFDGENVERIA